MKTADLYVRVSTDEQADKGYSQRNQEEVLKRYCEINSIVVRDVIFEDHSAKTFKRPEWSKLLLKIKKFKGKSDLILFTKWDRFSRNAGDAYQMISQLRRLGVEPQAVEQPLDLTIPENKMMLAFYLAAPEVENDRRALNVFHGMRRAKKEGRWMGTAPLGYINKSDDSGRKYISPKEPEAGLIQWSFSELDKGVLAADQIRKEANKKGLKCSRSNFWTLVRNPIYCGKIFVPAHKDEPSKLVDGLHKPLITEALFNSVQEILDGNKRKSRPKTKVSTTEQLSLRGFLTCPECGHMLTGSGSKGKYQVYYYYHCQSPCNFRFRSDAVNSAFVNELKKFKPQEAILELYKNVIVNAYKRQFSQNETSTKAIVSEIERVNAKVSKARDLLLSDAIDAADYKIIKTECDDKLKQLDHQLTTKADSTSKKNIEDIVHQAVSNLSNIDYAFSNADVIKKRQIISSIYPEKLCFDGKQYRTPRINAVANLIFQVNNDLRQIKNRNEYSFNIHSGVVARRGIEPCS